MWKTRTKIVNALLVFLVITFAFELSHCKAKDSESESKSSTPAVITAKSGGDDNSAVNLSTIIAKVAKDAIPAVVHVEVTERQVVQNPLAPFENDPFFQYFFNLPRNMPRKFQRELLGLGSGVIIDPQGYILTNNHVVAGANKIEVLLSDGNQYKAEVVGTDPKTDLAVIRIKAGKPLPYLTFGDSDAIEVGDWVVAIGQPRGLSESVTQGIISAKHRRGITNPTDYQDYLQTDAAINPGNSGGPLLTLQGKVIGINSAIVSTSGGFQGIGFAIPSNMAVYVAKQLIAHGKVERGWLGVEVQTVTPVLAKSEKLSADHGALVRRVEKDSPAEKAGLKKGDIITAYEGQPVPDASTLQNIVASTTIGKEVSLTVNRHGKTMHMTVKIGNLKTAAKVMASEVENRLGVEVQPVAEQQARQYGMSSPQGVIITSVQNNGPLGQAGAEVNDIILAINQVPITNMQVFTALVTALKPGQRIQVTVLDHRSGQEGNILVKVR